MRLLVHLDSVACTYELLNSVIHGHEVIEITFCTIDADIRVSEIDGFKKVTSQAPSIRALG
jgi:hypothetical protein